MIELDAPVHSDRTTRGKQHKKKKHTRPDITNTLGTQNVHFPCKPIVARWRLTCRQPLPLVLRPGRLIRCRTEWLVKGAGWPIDLADSPRFQPSSRCRPPIVKMADTPQTVVDDGQATAASSSEGSRAQGVQACHFHGLANALLAFCCHSRAR